MPCCQGQDYDRMFDARTASRDLRAYEHHGPRGATLRLLNAVRDALRADDITTFTHLDVGGGIGVLQHELAATGATRITAVDASAPYLQLLKKAAVERGYASRQVRIEGDFTEVADSVEPATVVTLDKVICCYPDMPSLVAASAAKATHIYGIVIPNDTTWLRFGVRVVNWILRHVLRRQFQAHVHSHREIDAVCAGEGLELAKVLGGGVWGVRVYRRAA